MDSYRQHRHLRSRIHCLRNGTRIQDSDFGQSHHRYWRRRCAARSTVPVQARPKYIGSLGSVFGVTSILGPILGGYLTSVSWRWCFWINVPVGGVSMAMLTILTPKCTSPVQRAATWKGKIFQLDPFGYILIATYLICLLLAIQFGSNQYSWSSGVVVGLFVIAGVFCAAFIAFQIWRGKEGTIPSHVISERSVLAGSIASLGIGSVLVLFSFYLPIWFQVIQGKSPEESGLSLIPLLLSVIFAVIASGIFVSAVRYYMSPMLLGSALVIVGAGLISTWSIEVGPARWIGFQVSKSADGEFHWIRPGVHTTRPKYCRANSPFQSRCSNWVVHHQPCQLFGFDHICHD
jgi:MFS family permease